MSAADFGILDFLLDKEMDGCKAFKNTSFSHLEDANIIKEEILTSDWDADELLNSMLNPSDVMNTSNGMNAGGGSGSDVMDSCDVITDVMDPNDMINGGGLHTSLSGPVTSKADDLDSLDGLVGLPFDAVLDSGASDSGFSNSDLSFDQQLSPQSVWSTGSGMGGVGTGSPHTALSPDHPGSICSTTSGGGLPSEPAGVADLSNLPGFGPVLGSTTEGGCGDDLLSPMLSGIGGGTAGGSSSHLGSSSMDIDDFPQPDSGISSPIPQQTSSPQHYANNLNLVTSTRNNSISNTVTLKPTTASSSSTTTSTTPLLKTVTLAAPTFNTNNTVITSCISSQPDPSNTATLTFSSPSPASSPSTSSASPSTSTTTTLNGMSGQTIVVTQGGGSSSGGGVGPTRNSVGSLVRNGTTTLLKTGANSRSILLPVTVKDLNQVRTIKIISAGGSASGMAGRGVRTVVSTVRTPSSGALSSTVVNRRATTLATSATPIVQRNTSTTSSTATIGTVRVLDTKGATVLKASSGSTSGVSTTITSPVCSSSFASASTVTMIKEENSDDDDDESVQGHPYQQVVLNDEERRLLKKEGIMLPTHYPLTKQEERELKRIRRKIRNKISAQDSRKRKKEYIDGLEDRVKACTEENQELQKRIRHLEAQNESLVTQLRRFQNLVTGGGNLLRNVHSGHTPHTSTALMMLILSAALFIVPSLKPQDASGLDGELSLPTGKMPTAGRSRSLLEAGSSNPSLLQALESVEGLEEEELQDSDMVMSVPSALSDHDYEPPSKRHRTSFKMHDYIVPPLDDTGPKHVSLDKGGTVDRGGTLESSHSLSHSVDNAGTKHNNFSDPGGDGSNNIDIVKRNNQENLVWTPSRETQNSSTGSAQSVVVKLGKTLIDEFELE